MRTVFQCRNACRQHCIDCSTATRACRQARSARESARDARARPTPRAGSASLRTRWLGWIQLAEGRALGRWARGLLAPRWTVRLGAAEAEIEKAAFCGSGLSVKMSGTADGAAAAVPEFSDLMLVGEVGRRWQATQLERGEEGEAAVQRSMRLRSEPVRHVLTMLEEMGESREQMTADLVTDLKRALLPMIPSLERDRLLALLSESFAYLAVDELRPVPIAVLEALAQQNEIPPEYLLRLATRPDLIAILPLALQRLVWAKDANPQAWDTVVEAERPCGGGGGAFRAELRRLLLAYVDSDSVVAATQQFGPTTKAAGQSPQARRAAQLELGKLADAIEGEEKLYKVALEDITKGWLQACASEDGANPAAWCALRSELVLLIADRKQFTVAKTDPAFDIALSLDTASRDGEVKKGSREEELQRLISWAPNDSVDGTPGAIGSDTNSISDAERMVLGSPFVLPMLIRTMLMRMRDAVDSPTSAAAVSKVLANPATDESTRFFAALVSAALDPSQDESAILKLISGLGSLGLLLLHDSTGLARRAKRTEQRRKHAKGRQYGASAIAQKLPDLPDLGNEKSIAAALSAEQLCGLKSWTRVLLFYVLQRIDRRDSNPSPPANGMLLRGALLAAASLQLESEVEGQWCTALAARCTAMHQRGTLPPPVRAAMFNGYFCDAVRRQLPPNTHAVYVRLLGNLIAPPAAETATSGSVSGGVIKAPEALPLVGTALAAAETRGWFASLAEGSSDGNNSGDTTQVDPRPSKRARAHAATASTSQATSVPSAQRVVAAYASLKQILVQQSSAFAPVIGMIDAKLKVEQVEKRDPFFG